MSNYFKQVPDFEYVSLLPDARISDYITVKNLFKRGKLRDDIFQDLTFFTKYQIKGDDRPDNVANEVYEDPTLDWIVLLSNNIINIQTEWPMLQNDFDRFLLDKYETYENLNATHHYETQEVKNSKEEGINFLWNMQPIEIIGKNKVEGVKFVKTELKKTDIRGREIPVPIKGSEKIIKA